MPIRFTCPSCLSAFNVPDDKAGKKTKCPKCASMMTVPDLTPIAPSPPAPPPPEKSVPAKVAHAKAAVYVPREPPPEPVAPVPIIVQVPSYEPERRRFDHTHRARGSFGSAFGATMGCMVAVTLFVCGGGIGLFYFIGKAGEAAKNAIAESKARLEEERAKESKLDGVVDPDSEKPKSGSSKPEKPSIRYAVAGKEAVTVKGVKAEVISVRTGKVPLVKLGDQTESVDEFVMIQVRLSTDDPAKKYDHVTWHDRESFTFDKRIEITDDVGNSYHVPRFQFTTKIKDAPRAFTVMQGKPQIDFIPFDVPVPAAKEIRITLHLQGGSAEDVFRFSIPRDLLKTK